MRTGGWIPIISPAVVAAAAAAGQYHWEEGLPSSSLVDLPFLAVLEARLAAESLALQRAANHGDRSSRSVFLVIIPKASQRLNTRTSQFPLHEFVRLLKGSAGPRERAL